MSEHLAEVIPLFKRELTPEQRAHLERRVADLAFQAALLDTERLHLLRILGEEDA